MLVFHNQLTVSFLLDSVFSANVPLLVASTVKIVPNVESIVSMAPLTNAPPVVVNLGIIGGAVIALHGAGFLLGYAVINHLFLEILFALRKLHIYLLLISQDLIWVICASFATSLDPSPNLSTLGQIVNPSTRENDISEWGVSEIDPDETGFTYFVIFRSENFCNLI